MNIALSWIPFANLRNFSEGLASKILHAAHIRTGEVVPEVRTDRMRMILQDELRQFIDLKWERFGKRVWLGDLVQSSLTMVLWALYLMLPNSWRLNYENLHTHTAHNCAIISCEALACLLVILRTLFIFKGIACHRSQYFIGKNRRWCEFHVSDCLVVSMFITSWIFRGVDAGRGVMLYWEDFFAAIGQLLGWFGVLGLLIATRFVGPSLLMVKDMVLNDVAQFLGVFCVVFLAFLAPLYMFGASVYQSEDVWTIVKEMIRPVVGAGLQLENLSKLEGESKFQVHLLSFRE